MTRDRGTANVEVSEWNTSEKINRDRCDLSLQPGLFAFHLDALKQAPVRSSSETGVGAFAGRRGYSTLSGILATLINGRASWSRS